MSYSHWAKHLVRMMTGGWWMDVKTGRVFAHFRPEVELADWAGAVYNFCFWCRCCSYVFRASELPWWCRLAASS